MSVALCISHDFECYLEGWMRFGLGIELDWQGLVMQYLQPVHMNGLNNSLYCGFIAYYVHLTF